MRTCRNALSALIVLLAAAAGGPLAGPGYADQAPAGPPAAVEEKEPPAAAPKVPPELRRVLDKLDEANKKVKDMTADINYTREIPLLEEREQCTGTLAFKKPYLIHMKLGKPRREEVCTDGKWWWIVSHKDKQVEIYRVERPREASPEAAGDGQEKTQAAPAAETVAPEASFMDFGYGKSSDKLLKDYRITLAGQSTEKVKGRSGKVLTRYRLKFVPRKDAQALFYEIQVELADDLWLPCAIVLKESEGEIIHTLKFKNIKLNRGLKAGRFTYKPKRGYRIERPVEVRPERQGEGSPASPSGKPGDRP